MNESSGPGLAVALKAVGSGGIADYWKFFPRSDAVATDSRGNKYEVASASGLGFARDETDWTILTAGNETSLVLVFQKSGRRRPGHEFTLSAGIRVVWYPRGSKETSVSTFTVFLKNIRPEGALAAGDMSTR